MKPEENEVYVNLQCVRYLGSVARGLCPFPQVRGLKRGQREKKDCSESDPQDQNTSHKVVYICSDKRSINSQRIIAYNSSLLP